MLNSYGAVCDSRQNFFPAENFGEVVIDELSPSMRWTEGIWQRLSSFGFLGTAGVFWWYLGRQVSVCGKTKRKPVKHHYIIRNNKFNNEVICANVICA